jgi:hypothetical protein
MIAGIMHSIEGFVFLPCLEYFPADFANIQISTYSFGVVGRLSQRSIFVLVYVGYFRGCYIDDFVNDW